MTWSGDTVRHSQIAKFMGPTWGPPGSCRPQMGPMLAPCTLLSGLCKCMMTRSLWMGRSGDITYQEYISSAFGVKLPASECHRISTMISQHWVKWGFVAVRQQAITWINVDQIIWRHMTSIGQVVYSCWSIGEFQTRVLQYRKSWYILIESYVQYVTLVGG